VTCDCRAGARDDCRPYTNRTTYAFVTILVAAAAFAIQLLLAPSDALTPPPDSFPVFAALVLLEALALGFGIAYLIDHRQRIGAMPPLLRNATFAAAWLFVSPWPHDLLHRYAERGGVMNWWMLAAIEYVFHLGIVPAGLLIAAAIEQRRRDATAREGTAAGAVLAR